MKKLFTFFVAFFAACTLFAGNVITYTASEQLEETTFISCAGLHINAFSHNITNHSFYSGTGILIFTGDVTVIGFEAFYGCSGITSITIPNSVTSIGNGAFFNCTGLTSISIPEGVSSIGAEAFYNCTNLASITFPLSITSIGNGAFYDCANLADITLPERVSSIGEHAFYGCSSLTSIVIPDSVTTINNFAFYGCSGLMSITIPNSVTKIKSGAFGGCPNITSIRFKSVTPPSLGGYVFGAAPAATRIYIPCGAFNAYAFALPNFTNFIEEDCEPEEPQPEEPEPNDDITGQPDDESHGEVVVKVLLTAVPAEGYTFLCWDDYNSSNPRTVELDAEKRTYTAYFVNATPTSDSANSAPATYTQTYDILGRKVSPDYKGVVVTDQGQKMLQR